MNLCIMKHFSEKFYANENIYYNFSKILEVNISVKSGNREIQEIKSPQKRN